MLKYNKEQATSRKWLNKSNFIIHRQISSIVRFELIVS